MCSALLACVFVFGAYPALGIDESNKPILCFDDYSYEYKDGVYGMQSEPGHDESGGLVPSPDKHDEEDEGAHKVLGYEDSTLHEPSSEEHSKEEPDVQPSLESKSPTSLDEAVTQFMQNTKMVHPRNWENFRLSNFSMHVTFHESSEVQNGLTGNFTLHEFYLVITAPVRVADKPTYTYVDDGVDLTYKYLIGAGLEGLYFIHANSEQMAGRYKAKFTDIEMNAGLLVRRGKDGKCQYEGNIDIAKEPTSFEATANNHIKFKSANLTKKAEIIVNTFVLHEILVNEKLGVKDKLQDNFKSSFVSQVQAMVGDFTWGLCDFLNNKPAPVVMPME